MIKYKICDFDLLTFPLIIVNFDHVFIQPAPMEYTTAHLFADDTNITASGKSVGELKRTLNLDLVNVEGWLSANKLCL